MVQPTQLDPTEQDALVKQIGLAMLRAAPEDWDQITVDYRAVGRYFEADGEIIFASDETGEWPVPAEIAGMFARLRAGMYREGRGTWFNARYRLDHPSSYNLDYDRDEPEWNRPPPPQAYGDDLAMYPRSEENIPDWLLRRRSEPPPPPPPPVAEQPKFRVARIFDGAGSNGRPVVNRRPVPEEDRAQILDYLNSAPMVRQSRALDVDRLDPEPRPLVPVAFHTDGIWIWPAAVNYYLHNYGVAPEPELVEHIRRMRFQLPPVEEAALSAASAFLGPPPPPAGRPPRRPALMDGPPSRPLLPGGPPPPMPAAGLPTSTGSRPPPSLPAAGVPTSTGSMPPPLAAGVPTSTGSAPPPHLPLPAAGLPTPTGSAPPPPAPTLAMPPPTPTNAVPREPAPPPREAAPPPPPPAHARPAGPPPAALPSQGPPSRTIDALRSRLSALGVPESAYRIGPPAERTWTMDQTPEGWRVGWYEREFVAPAIFEDVADAAAFLLGKIMLDAGRREAAPEPPPPPPPPPAPGPEPVDEETLVNDPVEHEEPMRAPQPTMIAPPPTVAAPPPPAAPQPTVAAPRPAVAVREPEPEPQRAASTSAQSQRWPIQPLPGEPPLTLFRGKRMLELAAGTEVDRYGEPDGNLTYAAGTPFPERSLVPEWFDRPVRTYRVAAPMEVLSGTAIPWFDQPGGGTAYLLPAAIEDLLSDGRLIEIPGRG